MAILERARPVRRKAHPAKIDRSAGPRGLARLAVCLGLAFALFVSAGDGHAAEEIDAFGVLALEDTNWGVEPYQAEKPRYDARVAFYEGKYAAYDKRYEAARIELLEMPDDIVRIGSGYVAVSVRSLDKKFRASSEHTRLWEQYFDRDQIAFALQGEYTAVQKRLGDRVKEDPAARRELWTLHLKWLKARTAAKLAEAIYHEVRVATIKIDAGWWNRLFETTEQNLSLVANHMWDKSADILTGACVDDFMHKVLADLAVTKALGTSIKTGFAGLKDRVVAAVAPEVVVALATRHDVVAFAALDPVVAQAARQDVVALAAVDLVVARAAVQRIGTLVALDLVVPAASQDDVIPIAPVDLVGALGPDERIVALRALDLFRLRHGLFLLSAGPDPAVGTKRLARANGGLERI